jgi:acyl-CoA dehydrogenase
MTITGQSTGASELDEILSALDRFVEVEVEPLHEQHSDILANAGKRYDERGVDRPEVVELIRHVRQVSAEAGFYTMTLPTEIGGSGLDNMSMFRVWEFMYERCNSHLWLGHHALAHWTKGPSPLLAHLSPEVRGRYLPGLLSGTKSMCFAMSEPDAGSDSWMMQTRAQRADGGWIINGSKQWISNGATADVAIIFAVTDLDSARSRAGGIGAFVTPTDASGFNFVRVDSMFGQPGSNEAELAFVDLFVPDDHVLGDPQSGFRLAMQGVTLGKIYNCGKAIGLASWALERAIDYGSQRTTFGSNLLKHQAVGFALADAAMDLHGARLVCIDCMQRLDQGDEARQYVAMAKVTATEMAIRVIDRAMQVHGASGFTNSIGLAEAWHMARLIAIADGSSEILRRQIANSLTKRRAAIR